MIGLKNYPSRDGFQGRCRRVPNLRPRAGADAWHHAAVLHGLSDAYESDKMRAVDDRFARLRSDTASALLRGPGATPPELRQAIAKGCPPQELMTLVQKIRSRAYTVTDQDLDAVRGHYTEDQLFEIIVASAFGAASERLAVAHRALEEA
jgi:hypothetical protein